MKKITIVICLILAAIVSGLVCRNRIIRFHVAHNHDRLQRYAVQMLEQGERISDRYGLWKTSCYPDSGMVEFHTCGFGLAPGATYKGFYYSADNTHKPFSAAGSVSLEIDKDYATWTDGTDNHGTSIRIADNWFWYEASF